MYQCIIKFVGLSGSSILLGLLCCLLLMADMMHLQLILLMELMQLILKCDMFYDLGSLNLY